MCFLMVLIDFPPNFELEYMFGLTFYDDQVKFQGTSKFSVNENRKNAENSVTLFCFSTKFKIFKKFCLDIPKYTLKNC